MPSEQRLRSWLTQTLHSIPGAIGLKTLVMHASRPLPVLLFLFGGFLKIACQDEMAFLFSDYRVNACPLWKKKNQKIQKSIKKRVKITWKAMAPEMPPLASGSTSFHTAPRCACPPTLAHTDKAWVSTDFRCPLEKQPVASHLLPPHRGSRRKPWQDLMCP